MLHYHNTRFTAVKQTSIKIVPLFTHLSRTILTHYALRDVLSGDDNLFKMCKQSRPFNAPFTFKLPPRQGQWYLNPVWLCIGINIITAWISNATKSPFTLYTITYRHLQYNFHHNWGWCYLHIPKLKPLLVDIALFGCQLVHSNFNSLWPCDVTRGQRTLSTSARW